MASLTITVPDNAVTRIRAAFTKQVEVNGVITLVPMTVAEIENEIKNNFIKPRVAQHESDAAARTVQQSVNGEIW